MAKITVTKLFGGNEVLGQIDAKVGMTTNYGTIVNVGPSGAITVGSGAPTEGKFTVYPHQLFVNYTHATGRWSYPSGDGSIPFGHETFATPINSGMVYLKNGVTPTLFSL